MNMSIPKNHQAFSMIELLVVLSIVATLIGLVGPLTLDTIEKHQAKAEVSQLTRLLSRYSNQAFIRGHAQQLKFEDASIIDLLNLDKQYHFSYIRFPLQQIQFNTSGVAQQRTLIYEIRDNRVELEIFEVIYD